MRRLWLIFAQTVTLGLAILFVLTTVRPDWLRAVNLGASLWGDTAVTSASNPQSPASYANGVARIAPAVVNVYTAKRTSAAVPTPDDPVWRQLFGDTPGLERHRTMASLGSGVIVSDDGFVLTNYHVVEAADAIEVALTDGRQSRARLVGADPETDLAVLKLADELKGLPAAPWAADRSLSVGDVVLAIGNPFGVGQTTTLGIVSALGRNGLGINTYENFIQTDAAINPGNSGGALIDAHGNLVGINTAIYAESGGGSLGIGFAIPVDTARKVMHEIVQTGAVKRGWLGIEPQDITPDLARAFKLKHDSGAVVAGVIHNGPAGKAGLRVGDIVRRVNGVEVANTSALLGLIAELPIGQAATLNVLRSGKPMDVRVQVGTRPRKPGSGRSSAQ